MNQVTLAAALEPVVRDITEIASQNAAFQANLRLLWDVVKEMLDNQIAVVDAPMPETTPSGILVLDENVAIVVDDGHGSVMPRPTTYDFPDVEDIEPRCRLKAKGAAWAATRQKMIREGVNFRDTIAPEDQKLISEAKKLECLLWTNFPSYSPPSNLDVLTELSRHYEALADAFCLVCCLLDKNNPRLLRESLVLLALANRMLRNVVEMANGPRDNDQQAVYLFLKRIAQERGIYIAEMCNDTPLPELQEIAIRIEAANKEVQEFMNLDNERQSHFKAAEYHAKLIASSRGSATDWTRMIEEIDALLAGGVPPSNVRIREMLLPLIEEISETLLPSPHFQRVLDEINKFLEDEDIEETTDRSKPTAIVEAAARKLKGKSVVMIGGDPRPEPERRLREQLKLNELVWIKTDHGDSYKGFEPYIAREDVAVVLLAIRWASHSFGEADKLCRKHGKPFVRLTGGYSPNQVAHQIMEQCGDRLKPSAV